MDPEPLLEVSGASRRFGYRQVFREISLEVRAGDLVALIGPNGAGKTTLLRVLAGLLKPTSGSVTRRGPVGFVGHESMLYDALTADENLGFQARLLGLSPDRVATVLERVGLHERRHDRVRTFSRGMTQRLAIARALLAEPAVLLMDEPTTGLDQPGCALLLDTLRELLDRERGVVVVTHQYEQVAPVVNRVGFLVAGSLDGPRSADEVSVEAVMARYRTLLAGA